MEGRTQETDLTGKFFFFPFEKRKKCSRALTEASKKEKTNLAGASASPPELYMSVFFFWRSNNSPNRYAEKENMRSLI